MDNFLERVFIEPFDRFKERILEFLPNILTSILILFAGILLGIILKNLFLKIFRAIKLDKFSERSGIVEIMQKGGIKDPVSMIVARIMSWVIIFVFIILSLQSLNIPSIEHILEIFILYLPNIFVAAIILLFGYILSNFFGRAALIASVNAGIKVSGLIGKLVKLTIFLLSITMALEQLGIGRETIIIAFAIIFGGIVLALSLAFGLGGKDIAKEHLEKKLRGDEKEKDNIKHM
jgi:hypothetical protein